MSSYGDYMKERAKKESDFFFGEGNRQQRSNKYFTFKHVLDNDTIIINTKNIKVVKSSPVLIVGDQEAIYLKEWQIRKAHNWDDLGADFYLVKLTRKFFKVYKFNSQFNDMFFDGKVETFDDLKEVAEEQDRENMKVALGFMKF